MSRRKPRNLAEALATSSMRVELEPLFVARLGAMLAVGADEWAAAMVRGSIAGIGKPAGQLRTVRHIDGNRETYNLGTQSGRAKLHTFYKREATWSIKLGLTADQALELVPEDQRAATADLMAEEISSVFASMQAAARGAVERDKVASLGAARLARR